MTKKIDINNIDIFQNQNLEIAEFTIIWHKNFLFKTLDKSKTLRINWLNQEMFDQKKSEKDIAPCNYGTEYISFIVNGGSD